MKFIVAASVFVFSVLRVGLHSASVSDRDPKRCCVPDQIQYTLGESVGFTDHGRPGLTQMEARVAADFKKKKLAVREIGYTDGKLFNLTAVADYNAQVMYVVDETKQKCTKQKLPSKEMTGQCVPPSAKYIGSPTFGLGTVLKVDNWVVEMKDVKSRTALTVYFSMTADSCVPVTEGILGAVGDVHMFAGISFYDVKNTVPDPSIFNVPDLCKKGDVLSTEESSLSLLHRYIMVKHQMQQDFSSV